MDKGLFVIVTLPFAIDESAAEVNAGPRVRPEAI